MARNTPRKAVKTTGRGFHSQPKDAELEEQAQVAESVTRRGVLARAIEFLKGKKQSTPMSPVSFEALKRRNRS